MRSGVLCTYARNEALMEHLAVIERIGEMSSDMAAAAERDLTANVEHCPGWTVADLVSHIADVQWFWADVVGRRVMAAENVRRPSGTPPGYDAVSWFRQQTDELTSALHATEPDDAVWTWWAPAQHAAFVARRQLIEVAVHSWDAHHAVGQDMAIPSAVAVLGLIEFAEVMAHDLRVGQPPPPLVRLEPTDSDFRGALFAKQQDALGLALQKPAADILLTLWGRGRDTDPRIEAAIAAVDLG